ncbi:MAG: hypothetical protein AAFW97_14595 [Pseudomonadota bacterium]
MESVLQDTAYDGEENELVRREKVLAAQEAIVGRLRKLAIEARDARNCVEIRWLEDMHAYHGVFDSHRNRNKDEMFREDEDAQKAMFVNITRPKTNAMEAKLGDLLFPVDLKNWGLEPTPRPDLTDAAKQAIQQAEQIVEQANQAEGQGRPDIAQALVEQGSMEASTAKQVAQEMDEARKRAEGMERTIDDQLTEANYYRRSRDVISDACRLGTGVVKGPLNVQKARRSWELSEENVYELQNGGEPTIEYVRVDPWTFFPDPSAASMEDCEYAFQRHLPTKAKLRKLARRPGFNKQAIRDIVTGDTPKAAGTDTDHLSRLRQLTGETEKIDGRYVLWEYHGPLESEEIAALLQARAYENPDNSEMADDARRFAEEVDPLEEIDVIAFFCEDKLIYFSEQYPMESGEMLYNTFSLEKGEASVLGGVGIPRVMRDAQRTLNAAWQMMLDNAALSVAPQVLVDVRAVEPADNDWAMAPGKIWQYDANKAAGGSPFQAFNIPMNQQQLAGIIQLARGFIDDETALPSVMEGGEQGQAALITQTANGMAMLFNAANLNIRRIVKNWDDDITEPVIRRAYDWNMQHNSDDSIKGDVSIEARGTSVLLVREIQAQNLMQLANEWSVHPVISPAIKTYRMLEMALQSMSLSPGEVLKTEDEFEEAKAAIEQQQAESGGGVDPTKQLEMETKVAIAQYEGNWRMAEAQMQRETRLMELAEKMNMKEDELRNLLRLKKYDTDTKIEVEAIKARSSERKQAHEFAGEKALAREGLNSGSGGNFSIEEEEAQ